MLLSYFDVWICTTSLLVGYVYLVSFKLTLVFNLLSRSVWVIWNFMFMQFVEWWTICHHSLLLLASHVYKYDSEGLVSDSLIRCLWKCLMISSNHHQRWFLFLIRCHVFHFEFVVTVPQLLATGFILIILARSIRIVISMQLSLPCGFR